jgi:hypothetical protein
VGLRLSAVEQLLSSLSAAAVELADRALPPMAVSAADDKIASDAAYARPAAAAAAAVLLCACLVAIIKMCFRHIRVVCIVALGAVYAASAHAALPLMMKSRRNGPEMYLCLVFLIVCPHFLPCAVPPDERSRIAGILTLFLPCFALLPSVIVAAVGIALGLCILAATFGRWDRTPHSGFRTALQRILLMLCCLYVLLQQGPAARRDKYEASAADAAAYAAVSTAADAAAPVLLIILAITRPLAALGVICLRMWLLPTLPPLLLPAFFPAFVISTSILCGSIISAAVAILRRSNFAAAATAAAAAATAVVVLTHSSAAPVHRLIWGAAAAVNGAVSDAGQTSLLRLGLVQGGRVMFLFV